MIVYKIILVAVFTAEDNVADSAEEITEIGAEGNLQVGLDVFALGGLHLVDGLGGVAVVIEGGQESGLHLGAQLLHLGGVEAEIVARKRANTDELTLALEHVEEHGELRVEINRKLKFKINRAAR